MKIYLSGPMSKIPNGNVPAFKSAAEQLRKEGYEVISPVELDLKEGVDPTFGTPETKYWDFLLRDVRVLGESGIEAVFVLEGWQLSLGARFEVALANILDLPIYNFDPRNKISVNMEILHEQM